MISFALLKGFMRKEFLQSLRDPRMKILLFVTPVIQLVIFGIALSTDVKNIRLWATPSANDYVLQHIYEHSIESGWFLPVKYANYSSYGFNADLFNLLRGGKIDAALVAPPGGLTKALGRGTANLQLLIDATNVIQAQTVDSYLQTISQKVMNTDLKLNSPQNPLNFSVRVLFNPNLETSFFMVPAVVCIILCVTTVILTSMSITREKENGTLEMLISAPILGSDIVLGKTLPFMILGMINAPVILAVAVLGFNVPMRGSVLVLLLVSYVFVCTTVAIGTLISTIARNQQQAMLGGFLFLFPAILLSGILFPIENMPETLKWLSYIDPLSHYLYLLRNILLKGGEMEFVLKHTAILVSMGLIFIYISFKRFHTTLQ